MNSTLAANPLQNVRNVQNKCLKSDSKLLEQKQNDFTSENTLSSPSAPHLHHPYAPKTKRLKGSYHKKILAPKPHILDSNGMW